MENGYICHHGVKGQKWGVRKKKKRAAREAAILRGYSKEQMRMINRNKKSIARTQKRYDKTMARKTKKLKDNQQILRAVNNERDKRVKNLSSKDIIKGERYIKALDLAAWPLAMIPIVGPGIAGGIAGGKSTVLYNAIVTDGQRKNTKSTKKV